MLSSLIVLLLLNAGSASAYNYTALEQSWLSSFGNTAPSLVNRVNAGPSSTSAAGLPVMTKGLLAKAAPDECYNGIGNPFPPGPPCSQGKPKVNQSYVWGLTKYGNNLWFGTVANTLCLVMGSFLGTTGPSENTSWVCEYSNSASGRGDLRPPKIYLFNATTGVLQDKTPADPRINATIGIRSAGTIGNLIILGGPAGPMGINLFAYNGDTGAYLGSTSIQAYNDIRRWITIDGILYTGVGRTAGGGRVLKWTGTVANPWQYEEVGNLGTQAAEIAYHEGRIFAATWPSAASPGSLASLYMSPRVPFGGLTASQAAGCGPESGRPTTMNLTLWSPLPTVEAHLHRTRGISTGARCMCLSLQPWRP